MVLATLIYPLAAHAESPAYVFSQEVLGTEVRITTVPAEGQTQPLCAQAAEDAFAAMASVEARLTTWAPSSQLSQVNRKAAEEPVRVSPDVFEAVEEAQLASRITGGAFDITVGPLIALWNQARESGQVPSPESIAAAKAKVGYGLVQLDPEEHTIRFKTPGVSIGLDACAKGRAVDAAGDVLAQAGLETFLINAGGSTYLARGNPTDAHPGWWITVHNPYVDPEDSSGGLFTLQLCNTSLSLSGNYGRTYEISGVQYGHIFDPKTGAPVSGRFAAAAIHPKAFFSDALSTGFFVMDEMRIQAACRSDIGTGAVIVSDKEGQPGAITRLSNAKVIPIGKEMP